MKRRRGFSLILVLSFCVLVSLCMAAVALSLHWAGRSAEVEEGRLRDRLALTALIERGRGWLEGEVAAGRLSRDGGRFPAPKEFAEVRLLRVEEGGARVEVFDLNYGPGEVPGGGWDRSQGPKRFFPPGAGMFLVRAFKPTDGGINFMIEAVYRAVESEAGSGVWTLEQRPFFWQEVW